MRDPRTELSFRAPTKDDREFFSVLGRASFSRWSPDPASTLAAMLDKPLARGLVATLEGRPMGFTIVDREPLRRRFGPWQDPSVARVEAIAVVAGARGRGVGRALLERSEAFAREAGAVVMTLMTASSNSPARSLFAAAGYLPVLRHEHGYRNGESAIEMFKLLAS